MATKTQFIQSRGYRPEFFEGAATGPFKVITQFLRYDVSSAEAIKDILTKGGREAGLMRRGFAEEWTVVDALRSRRALLKGLDQGRKLGKVAPDLHKELSKALQTEIKGLEAVVNRVQPSRKFHELAELSKYVGKSFTAKFGKALTGAGVKEALIAAGLITASKKKKDVGDLALQTAQNMIPGGGTAKVIAGLLTGKTGDYPRQQMLSDLISVIPIAGEIEGTVPGRPLSAIINEQLKKKK